MSKVDVLVYGAGGMAREVAWLIEQIEAAAGTHRVIGFIDDAERLRGQLLNDLPVYSLAQARAAWPHACVVGGIGAPRVRQSVIEKARAAGFDTTTLIHPRVEMSRRVAVGHGSVICAGNILTTEIVLGQNVQINLDCTVGHDVIIGDHTTLAPGVHVSGWVHIGQRVYIGTGAVIINGTETQPLLIADDAVIGAGACVTKAVDAGTTVVGVPARPLGRQGV